jgi:hypothetical protein
MDAVTAVATLLNRWSRFFLPPQGFAEWSLDRQVTALNDQFKEAIRDKDYLRADLLYAAMRELREQFP